MWTPLHYAAMDGDIETMQVLLEFGANRKAGDGVSNIMIIYDNVSKQHQANFYYNNNIF